MNHPELEHFEGSKKQLQTENRAVSEEEASIGFISLDNSEDDKRLTGEENFLDSLARYYATCKDAATGVLMILSHECGTSFLLAKTGIITDGIQLFTFALQPLLTGDFTSILHNIVYFSDISNVLIFLLGFPLCLLLCLVLVVAMLFNVVYVGYGWSRSQFNVLWPIKLLRIFADLLIGLAFIPIIQIFAGILSCNDYSGFSCSILQPIVFAVATCFILLALCLSSTYFDPKLTSESPHACAHTRIAVFETFCKILLSSAHANNISPPELLRHLVILFCGASLTYLYIWYQPFYFNVMNKYNAVVNGIFLWFEVCMIIRYAFVGDASANGQGPTVVAALILGVVLVVPLTKFLLEFRLKSLRNSTIASLKNPYEFELVIRDLLQRNHPLLNRSKTLNGTDESLELIDDRITAQSQPLFFGGLEADVDSAGHINHGDDSEEKALIDKVRQLFDAARTKYQFSAQICLFQINFLRSFFDRERSLILSRDSMLIIEKRNPYFDIEFCMFKLRSEIKHQVSTGKEVVQFVAGEKYEREGKTYDRLACSQLLEFWGEVQNDLPNVARIHSLSNSAADYSAKAQVAYSNLIKLQQRPVQHLRLYGGFLCDVMCDTQSGSQILARADAIEKDRNHHKHNHKHNRMSSVQMSGADGSEGDSIRNLNAVLTFEICGSKVFHFGEISYVNDGAAFLLNNVSHKLLGRSIDDCVEPPFGSNLRSMVSLYFKEGWNPFFTKPIELFLKSGQGSCIQVSMNLEPFSNNCLDYTMFVSISPDEREFSDAPQILSGCEGYILCYGQSNLGRVFGTSNSGQLLLSRFTTLSPEAIADLSNSSVCIEEIFANYFEKRNEFTSCETDGVVTELKNIASNWKDYPNFCVKVKVQTFEYFGVTVDKVIIKVHGVDDIEGDDGNGDTASFAAYESSSDADDSDGERDYGDIRASESLDQFDEAATMNIKAPSKKQAIQNDSSEKPGAKVAVKRGPDSVSSGGSKGTNGSENTDSSTSTGYLRRRLQQAGLNGKSSPLLQRLRTTYICMQIFLLIAAGVSFWFQENIIQQYRDGLVFLSVAGYRILDAFNIAFGASALVALEQGINVSSALNETKIREEMHESAYRLLDVDKTIFDLRASITGLYPYYNVKNTPFYTLRAGVEKRTELYNLFESTAKIVGAAIQVADTPLSLLYLKDSEIYLVTHQLKEEASYIRDINKTVGILQESTTASVEKMLPVFAIACSLIFILQAALLILLVRPLVSGVERNKIEILSLLQSLPSDSIDSIAQRCSQRLLSVHQVAREVIESMYHTGSTNEKKKEGGKHHKISKRLSNQSAAIQENKSGCCKNIFEKLGRLFKRKSSTTVVAIENEETSHHSSSKRKNSLNAGLYPQFIVIGRMALPGLVTLLFYSLNFFVGFYSSYTLYAQTPASLGYTLIQKASLLNFKSGALLHILSKNVSLDFYDADYFLQNGREKFDFASKMIILGSSTYNGLLVEEEGTQPMIELLLEDGCGAWNASNLYTEAQCRNLYGGLLVGGLLPAMRYLVDEVMNIHDSDLITKLEDQNSYYYTVISDFFNLEANLIQPQLLTLSNQYVSATLSSLDQGQNIRIILISMCIVTNILTYLFVARFTLRTLDNEQKRVRRLLLMVPEDLYNIHTDLKAFLKREYATSDTV